MLQQLGEVHAAEASCSTAAADAGAAVGAPAKTLQQRSAVSLLQEVAVVACKGAFL